MHRHGWAVLGPNVTDAMDGRSVGQREEIAGWSRSSGISRSYRTLRRAADGLRHHLVEWLNRSTEWKERTRYFGKEES